MRKLLVGCLLVLALATLAHADALRAGTVTFYAGQSSVFVYFNTPLPWATQYVVSLQPVNSSGGIPAFYGGYCVYFDVNSKSPYAFQIQLKECVGGALFSPFEDIQLDWIVQAVYNPSY